MQIIINTAEMLGDETTIRDEVIAQVSHALTNAFREQVRDAISKTLDEEVRKAATSVTSEMTSAHFDTIITPTDAYGKQGTPYTLRNKIAELIASQCVYKKQNYDSDKNAFTKGIDEVVSSEIKKFKTDFNSIVTKRVLEQTMEHAVQRLRDAFNIK